MNDEEWRDGVRRTLSRHEKIIWTATVGIVGASITFGGILYAQGTDDGERNAKIERLEEDQQQLEGKVEDYQKTQREIFQTLGRIEGKLDADRSRDENEGDGYD